ncbi:MAG: hypothetical protein II669_04725, partial [Elusimicrobia bacterium]|nr:hypothetical protein [Elusimicrobiota bacterium]
MAIVNQILQENPNYNLETLATYLINAKTKESILTENRMVTINKRETSYEGLVSKLENGEDGLYNLIHEDKQTILQPKISITQQDLEDIPYLRQLRSEITRWEQALKKASGRNAYRIKKALIEMRKDQYLIKQSFKPPVTPNKLTFQHSYIPLDDTTPSPDSEPQGISFLNPTICAAFL